MKFLSRRKKKLIFVRDNLNNECSLANKVQFVAYKIFISIKGNDKNFSKVWKLHIYSATEKTLQLYDDILDRYIDRTMDR